MSRSKFKGPFFKVNIKQNQKWLQINNKNFTIIPEYINTIINIYNGKNYKALKITEKMIGFKFGEFILTRKKHIYKKKKITEFNIHILHSFILIRQAKNIVVTPIQDRDGSVKEYIGQADYEINIRGVICGTNKLTFLHATVKHSFWNLRNQVNIFAAKFFIRFWAKAIQFIYALLWFTLFAMFFHWTWNWFIAMATCFNCGHVFWHNS